MNSARHTEFRVNAVATNDARARRGVDAGVRSNRSRESAGLILEGEEAALARPLLPPPPLSFLGDEQRRHRVPNRSKPAGSLFGMSKRRGIRRFEARRARALEARGQV